VILPPYATSLFHSNSLSSEKDPTMNERIAGRLMDHVIAGMEGVLGELGYLRLFAILISLFFIQKLIMSIIQDSRHVQTY